MPRVKVDYRTASREVYDRFKQTHPEVDLSYEKWGEIIYAFNYMFRDYILETGERAKLPWGMGSFSVSKKKSKRVITYNGKQYMNMAIDWVQTHRLKKTIYLLNHHTDGFRFKWKWFIEDARFYQAEVWKFVPSRVSSRMLAERLKRPGSQYHQIYRQWERR